MQDWVRLLSSTEKLIKEVDANLKTLQSMDLVKQIRDEILPITRKIAAADKALCERKIELLEIFAEMARLMQSIEYEISIGCKFVYAFTSSGIHVTVVDINYSRGRYKHLGGNYAFARFVQHPEMHFYYFCDAVWRKVERFVQQRHEFQSREIQRIKELSAKLVELAST